MKNLLNKFLGYRWSLYITDDKKELQYIIHFDSVIGLIGYVVNYYIEYGNPKKPWHIYLNFNKTHTAFLLTKDYFTKDGHNLSKELLEKIKEIDPGYKVRTKSWQVPFVKDMVNNKEIKINTIDLRMTPEEMFKKITDSNKNETLYSVLNKIFK